eukprot:3146088-Amphidinium_carterae.1
MGVASMGGHSKTEPSPPPEEWAPKGERMRGARGSSAVGPRVALIFDMIAATLRPPKRGSKSLHPVILVE